MFSRRISPVFAAFLFAAGLLSVSGAEKLDLKRLTPVPANEQIPTMDFFRPFALQEPELNASGTHIAAIVTVGEDRHQLLVYDLKTRKGEMIGGPGDTDIARVDWLTNKRLVFRLGAQKMYGIGLFAADVGSIKSAYPLFQYVGSNLISVPQENPLRPLVWNRYDSLGTSQDLGVVTVNTDVHSGGFINLLSASATDSGFLAAVKGNGDHMMAHFPAPEPGIVWRYLTDKQGQLEFAFTSNEGTLALHQLVGGRWVKTPVDLENVVVVACGDKPGQLVVVGPRQQGKPRALQLMDGASGELGEVLLQDNQYDFDGNVYRERGSRNIVGAVFQRNGPKVTWFTEDYFRLQMSLEKFFPNLAVRIVSSNEAQTLYLVAAYSDRQPVIYKWIDLATSSAGSIKDAAPWIDPSRMQPMNIIKFKTRDGRELDAYLTLPAGASKTNLPPLVVLPHGGPWLRDGWGFDGEAQFLASRGYAVLQPNYRGSTSYDWLFPREDIWDFRKMHDDVTDAAKTMVASGLIDARRIAIMGGSFGGYLAVSGVVNEPALYRCAITIAGVFDWEQQISAEKYDRYEDPTYGRMMRNLGNPKKEPEKFDAISPGRHVDRIRVPVFVAGGKDDQTVEILQSKRLISDLEKYKVTHEKFLVGGEGHGMGHLMNQVELYDRIIAFLDKYLKPVEPAL